MTQKSIPPGTSLDKHSDWLDFGSMVFKATGTRPWFSLLIWTQLSCNYLSSVLCVLLLVMEDGKGDDCTEEVRLKKIICPGWLIIALHLSCLCCFPVQLQIFRRVEKERNISNLPLICVISKFLHTHFTVANQSSSLCFCLLEHLRSSYWHICF